MLEVILKKCMMHGARVLVQTVVIQSAHLLPPAGALRGGAYPPYWGVAVVGTAPNKLSSKSNAPGGGRETVAGAAAFVLAACRGDGLINTSHACISCRDGTFACILLLDVENMRHVSSHACFVWKLIFGMDTSLFLASSLL